MKPLVPFTSTPRTTQFTVSADFFQTNSTQLIIEFKISGPLEHIVWPAPGIIESREDGLWKGTCLEAFFSEGSQKHDPYVEINCSPNGNWNAYAFSSYRAGMTPSQNIVVRLKERSSDSKDAYFRIEVLGASPLNAKVMGLTTVIEFANGEKSYWALRHPAPQADFHDKGGWE